MGKSGFRFDFSPLERGIGAFQGRAAIAFELYSQQAALQLQNYARTHRRWTDRTGDARRRLSGSYRKLHNGYEIQIAHGVDYGLWLELAHEKRFAIIPETLEVVGNQQIMPGLDRLIDRLQKGGV